MSKNIKIILIITGVFTAFLLAGILGIVFLINRMADNAGFDISKAEGADFGKTVDYAGCQKEGLLRAQKLGLFDITDNVRTEYFVEGCLSTSRPSANFCPENLPTDLQDILNDNRWKDKECEKLGLKEKKLQCHSVLKARLDFCEKH